MIITPRWRKILSDLWSNRSRTLLVALSIGVGVFAVGLVSTMYFVMSEDVRADFLSSNPHDGMIYTSYFDDDLLAAVRHVQGVAEAQGHTAAGGKIMLPTSGTVDISFQGIPSLDKIKMDQIRLLRGKPTLGDKEAYVDDGSFTALGAKLGDTITVMIGNEKKRDLKVVGVVHDLYANSFGGGRTVNTYVNTETLTWLGGVAMYDRLMFTTKGGPHTEAYIRQVARRVADKITKSDTEVIATSVYPPGQHPAQPVIDSSLALVGGLGVLALFLSTFLVINTISALLNQQVRQIGVMKAVGGSTSQVMVMYLVLIMLFGVIAEIIAIPLAGWMGYSSAAYFSAQLINSTVGPVRIPPESLALMIIVGLAVPLIAGIVPVVGGVTKTVREAISDYGMGMVGARSWFDRLLESVRGLPRPLLISLRNTFRKKGRLVLTLFTLTLGGAIFIAVFNLSASMNQAVAKTMGYVLSDVNISFNHGYRMDRIQSAIADIPGVVSLESWGFGSGRVYRPDGVTTDEILIYSPPGGSKLVNPTLTAGRWLVKEDDNAVVVGNHFIKKRPDVKVGDTITIRINKKDWPFTVVGIYQMAGSADPPLLYMNDEYLARIQGGPRMVYMARVLTRDHTYAYQKNVADLLKAKLDAAGMKVTATQTGVEIRQQAGYSLSLLVMILMGMAVLIAIVGGLGLMGTMSMNVMERTREIGVMRSIGAEDLSIMQLVIVEGMIIGLISWALGTFLSIPITNALDYILGMSLLNVPLTYVLSMQGLVIWVIVVIFLSGLASVLPARRAVKLTVRDILAYE